MGFMMKKNHIVHHLLILELLFATLIIFHFSMVCMVEAKKVHYHDFILEDKNFTRGCKTKSMLVVNGQFPGPTLYVRRGDVVFVNVQNKGDYEVTIHWHGVNQPRNPWSDGPEFITQCPIEPGQNFTYEVIFSTEEGTLWWHAHNEWTRNTVHGAIVIYPEEGSTTPYPTPHGEQVLIFGSWYDYDVNLVVEQDLADGDDFPNSKYHLMNGLPGDFTPCYQENSTFRWSVDYNKTYLLRIVNAAMNAELFFSIAQHNLTVVGMDGDYLKPLVTSYILMPPGQTMDVLITTNQSSSNGQYYMATRQFISADDDAVDWDYTNTTAVLEYNKRDVDDDDKVVPMFPETTLPSFKDFESAYHFIKKLRSLANEAYPANVPMNITTYMFITIALNFYSNGTDNFIPGSSLNNITWLNTEMDILQAYYRNQSGVFTEDFPDFPPTLYNFTAQDLITNTGAVMGTKVKVLNFNDEVEIVFQGTNMLNSAEDHPMHLHGHSFYQVGFGSGNFDPLLDPATYNLVDPPYVNTFTVPKDGWIALRFKANNPGVWLWHCHIDKHLTWGMNTVFITKNGDTPESTMRDPPPNMPSCGSFSPITFRHGRSHRYFQKSA